MTTLFNSSFSSFIRRNLATVLTVAAFVSAIATYIAIAGGGGDALGIKPRRVLIFLIVDIVLMALLACIIGARIRSLWTALRAGSAGSQLQKRILVLFSLVTISPTIIVSVFSAFFFNFGIQGWFNDRVQRAVDESLAVAEAYLAEHKENIRGDAIAMANDLSQVAALAITDPIAFNQAVAAQTAMRLLTEAVVLRGNRIIAQGKLSFALAFEHIPQDMTERAQKGEIVIMTAEGDKVRALVRIDALENAFLMVGRLIDSRVLNHMEYTQGAVNEYNNLKNQLVRLQVMFSVVFMSLTLLLLLASIWYGMVFAARLTGPITGLVVAAERVRGGDYSARVAHGAEKDEIATLSRAFNRMTEQLEAQRGDLIDANRRLDERRRFSEAVLSGVSAGVIALDRNKQITLANRSAEAILSTIGQPILPGVGISEALPGILDLLGQAEALPGEVAQGTLTMNKSGRTLALHVRVTVERFDAEIEGFIVTFDDITLLVAAQRNAAWADVARRVAHEIKNPLTPIQLAAERLKRKYLKFITEDQEMFVKYTDTIVRHVGDIGKMVEEFVSFARLPTPRIAREDLAGIVRKAVFSAQVADPSVEYALDVPEHEVWFDCDERQMTQVMTNLLKNASEAIEARLAYTPSPLVGEGGVGGISPHGNMLIASPLPNPSAVAKAMADRPPHVSAEALAKAEGRRGIITVRLLYDQESVQVVVEDNGIGFPPGEKQKMLEPYVTTRTKGTGLGLAIVKKIVEDHRGGRITIENNPSGGARVVLFFLQHCDINAANEG